MRELEFNAYEFIRLAEQYLDEFLDPNEKLVIFELCKIISSKKSPKKLCRATTKELMSRSKIKRLKIKELYKIIERLERKGFVKTVKPLRRRRSRKAIVCQACLKLSGFVFFLRIAKQLPYYKPETSECTQVDESKILETLTQLKTLEKNIHLFSFLMKHPNFFKNESDKKHERKGFLESYQKHFLLALQMILRERLKE